MRGSRPECSSRAFTLIELVAVVGIALVLIGLIMPSLRGARDRADAVRSAVAMQQAAHLVSLYGADHGEVYPIMSPRLGTNVLDWWWALVQSGHAESERAIDPVGMKRMGFVTVAMSHCMSYDPARMREGRTEPIDLARCVPVRVSQVAYPSGKGTLYQWHARRDARVLDGWCCGEVGLDAPKLPIAFADNSVTEARWTELRSRGFMERWVGAPVASTWEGYLGLDR